MAAEDHADLAPSSAPIWGNCSGSVQAQRGRPSPETRETRRGTAGHWVAESVLRSLRDQDGGPSDCAGYVGKVAPNGVVVDEDIAEGAQTFVDTVLLKSAEWGVPLSSLLIESRVYMPAIHAQNWGTLDAALVDLTRGRIAVIDYKAGHRGYDPEGALQLIDYTNGLCELYGVTGDMHEHIAVELTIVQPFSYSSRGPVKTWRCMLSDLRPYWNKLAHQAEAAYSNPTLTTGLWCRDCTARVDCTAATAAGMNFIDLVEAPYAMDEKTTHDLAVERAMLDDAIRVARARLEAIEDQLAHRIGQGDSSGGLTLEATEGRLEFTAGYDQVVAFGGLFGVDLRKRATITPTQAVKAAPKEVRSAFQQALKAITRRPAGALTLKPIPESRTARAFMRK